MAKYHYVHKKITHDEWLEFKSKTIDFDDQYFDCEDTIISKLYYSRGCKYIQISNKGLYHLRQDICDFEVPFLKCEQHIRIRTKIHSRNNKAGYCNISTTMSFVPKKLNEIQNSKYSLDDKDNIPLNLYYQ